MATYTLVFALCLVLKYANAHESGCGVAARTGAGWVCGARRLAARRPYASFRGVPYAKQPLDELRFQELQPPDSWEGFLNATSEGPICPNHDVIYGPLMQPQGVSEACIHVNIHVPLYALPRGIMGQRERKWGHGGPSFHQGWERDHGGHPHPQEGHNSGSPAQQGRAREQKDHPPPHERQQGPRGPPPQQGPRGPPPHQEWEREQRGPPPRHGRGQKHRRPPPGGKRNRWNTGYTGLPIIVFIHGGSWITGSGDADLNGPEYLVGNDIIVITFNYRIDVFGFLSLNTTKVPGNNGLRDQLTLLRWVQANARHFGGDPAEVTLAGRGAGATCAHLLSLSPAATGLFKRVWLMSGTAMESFYTASPLYSQEVTKEFLSHLSLNSTDYDEVHDQLIQMPLEQIMNASRAVLDHFGISTFSPVIESPLPGVTTIIGDDPESLVAKGNGNNISMVIGFTDKECEAIRPRLEVIDAVAVYEENPLTILPQKLLFSLPSEELSVLAERVASRYFGDPPTMDEYVKLCTDSFFAYPAIKVARARVVSGGALVFLYKFAYNADFSPVKEAFNLSYSGAGHSEDLTYVLKVNSWPVSESFADEAMKDAMINFVVTFMKHNDPSLSSVSWPACSGNHYLHIGGPRANQHVELSDYDQRMVDFYDNITYTNY